MKANAQTEAAVMDILDRFANAFAKQDLHALIALFTPDPNVVCIGTEADEKCLGPSEIRTHFERNFAQCEDLSLEWGWSSVSALDSLAWMAAEGVAHLKADGQETHTPLRLTAVLERYEQKWAIVQMHCSTPDNVQAQGQSLPVPAATAMSPN